MEYREERKLDHLGNISSGDVRAVAQYAVEYAIEASERP